MELFGRKIECAPVGDSAPRSFVMVDLPPPYQTISCGGRTYEMPADADKVRKLSDGQIQASVNGEWITLEPKLA